MRWPLAIALCAAALLAACSNPPYPRGDMKSLFGVGPYPQSLSLQTGQRKLSGVQTPGTGGPMLLFVHGSPGDWKAWAHFLQTPRLASFGTRLAVDRPGFGGSGPGQVIPDLRVQAELLSRLIPDGQRAIVVGHSLGGPLVAWLAIDHPEKVCGAVSIAGSLAAQLEQPRWYNQAANFRVVQWLIPNEMVWSNAEMMPLSTELAQLQASWPRLRTPFILMQGGKDSLVDPRTADITQALAPVQWLTVQRLPDEDHFVLWKKPDLVVDTILSLPCAQAARAAQTAAAKP